MPVTQKGVGKHLRVDLNRADIQNVFSSLDSFLLCLIALWIEVCTYIYIYTERNFTAEKNNHAGPH